MNLTKFDTDGPNTNLKQKISKKSSQTFEDIIEDIRNMILVKKGGDGGINNNKKVKSR